MKDREARIQIDDLRRRTFELEDYCLRTKTSNSPVPELLTGYFVTELTHPHLVQVCYEHVGAANETGYACTRTKPPFSHVVVSPCGDIKYFAHESKPVQSVNGGWWPYTEVTDVTNLLATKTFVVPFCKITFPVPPCVLITVSPPEEQLRYLTSPEAGVSVTITWQAAPPACMKS